MGTSPRNNIMEIERDMPECEKYNMVEEGTTSQEERTIALDEVYEDYQREARLGMI